MRDYNDLAKEVEEIEARTSRPQTTFVSMEIGQGDQIGVTPKSYDKIMLDVFHIDIVKELAMQQARSGGRKIKMAKQQDVVLQELKAQPEPQPLQQPVAQPPPPASDGKEPVLVKKKPEARQFKMPAMPNIGMELKQTVSKEMSDLVKSTSAKAQQPPPQEPKMTMKEAQTEGLVMPNLSISDQVSELEKIIDNLRAGRFDKDETEIVVRELNGLQRYLKAQSAQAQPGSALQDSLVSIRDKRLSEALALLPK